MHLCISLHVYFCGTDHARRLRVTYFTSTLEVLTTHSQSKLYKRVKCVYFPIVKRRTLKASEKYEPLTREVCLCEQNPLEFLHVSPALHARTKYLQSTFVLQPPSVLSAS